MYTFIKLIYSTVTYLMLKCMCNSCTKCLKQTKINLPNKEHGTTVAHPCTIF